MKEQRSITEARSTAPPHDMSKMGRCQLSTASLPLPKSLRCQVSFARTPGSSPAASRARLAKSTPFRRSASRSHPDCRWPHPDCRAIAERPKRVLRGPRTPKGPVDCLHQFRCPLLSSQERLSLQAPLRGRHRTRRHRGPTRSRRDRSRYPGQMSRRWLTTRRRAATPRNLRGRLVPLTTISACQATAAGADQPLAPIEHGSFGVVPSSHLGGIGFHLP